MVTLRNYRLRPTILVVLGISALASYLTSLLAKNGVIVSISATTLVIVFLGLYDKWLWRRIPVLVHERYIGGRYKGTLTSEFNGATCGITIEITQTASTILIRQFTESDSGISKSVSIATTTSLSQDKIMSVDFSYNNEGHQLRKELDPHMGYCRLEFSRDRKMISGTYFTNRATQTKGTITAQKKGNRNKGKY